MLIKTRSKHTLFLAAWLYYSIIGANILHVMIEVHSPATLYLNSRVATVHVHTTLTLVLKLTFWHPSSLS